MLKCTEIFNHSVVYKRVIQCCNSTTLHKEAKTNNFIGKEIRFVVTKSTDWTKAGLDEDSPKVKTSSYNINSTMDVM